jgi:Ca-activated chloride channel family protein
MTFVWPAMLLCLLALPLLAWAYAWREQRRRALAARFGSLGLMPAGGALGWRRHVPPAFYLAGLAILLFALARPQAEVSVPRVEGTVILAFDVSGSMAADDLAPSRLEAAKAAAQAFVARQPTSVQIGVVSFSDSGFAVQAPTGDRAAVLAAIARLAPERGTALANGILAALNVLAAPVPDEAEPGAAPPAPALPPAGSAAIVLLTDGENTIAPEPLAAAQAAAAASVRIYAVGIGTAEGAVLEIEGFSVHTQLDEGVLRAMADLTGGAYFNAADEASLNAIYSELEPEWVVKREAMELTSLLAGAGLLALLIGGAFSLAWFGRLP